eukprot:10272965-Ditylum_brightwellii.AAC.1
MAELPTATRPHLLKFTRPQQAMAQNFVVISPSVASGSTDSGTKSYRNQTIKNHLVAQEKEKKKKYLRSCQEIRKNFTPFVVTCDRVFGHKAKMLMKQLDCALLKKWAHYVPFAYTTMLQQ